MTMKKIAQIVLEEGESGIFATGWHTDNDDPNWDLHPKKKSIFGASARVMVQDPDPKATFRSYDREGRFIPAPFEPTFRQWMERKYDIQKYGDEYWWVKRNWFEMLWWRLLG